MLTAVRCTLVFVTLGGVLYGLLVPDGPDYVSVVTMWGISLWMPLVAMLWQDAAREGLTRGFLRRWARGICRTGCALFVTWALIYVAAGILMLRKARYTCVIYIAPRPRVSPCWIPAAFLVSGLLTLAGMAALCVRDRARRTREA